RRAACAWIERHLGDGELEPQRIARGLGISTRYLHALFEHGDESVMRYLLRRRIERCREDLADAHKAHRTIADIAFAWGFSDVSHFGRAFKAAFGLAPREWRARAKMR